VKYDYWDPNTKVDATDFTNTTTTLTSGDIAYSTWGFGILYYLPWASNIRCMAYYEMPKNEKLTNVTDPKSLLFKYANNNTSATNLNLMTLRVQVKF
jgi:hypothetical protein